MNKIGYNQHKHAKPKIHRGPGFTLMTSIAAVASLGLVWLSIKIFAADMAGFRSCSANSSGLSIVSCGKQGFNGGDMLLLLLVLLCIALSFSLFTSVTRMVRGLRK